MEGEYLNTPIIYVNGTVIAVSMSKFEPSINGTCFLLVFWDNSTGNFAFKNTLSISDGKRSLTVTFMDDFGRICSATTYFTLDTMAPIILDIVQNPPHDQVQPNQNVTITARVQDYTSGVKEVTLQYRYRIGDAEWSPWLNITMSLQTENMYTRVIQGLPAGSQLQYRVLAIDNACNIRDYVGEYRVISEYSLLPVALLLVLTTLIIILLRGRKLRLLLRPTPLSLGLNGYKIVLCVRMVGNMLRKRASCKLFAQ